MFGPRFARGAALAALLSVAAVRSAADTIIDANSFVFYSVDPAQYLSANGFHMEVNYATGHQLIGTPTSSIFPACTVDREKADFTGGSILMGRTHEVRFKSTGSDPESIGWFTLTGTAGPRVIVSDRTKSIALDDTRITFTPDAVGGYDFTLTLGNRNDTALSGTVDVLVNHGYYEGFTLSDFDTLRTPVTILHTDYSLVPGQAMPPLSGHLDSTDEYVLISGTAKSPDLPMVPFAIGLTPITEPTSSYGANWYWKGGNASPMYDFDEKQDAWGALIGAAFRYTWCGPVALANSLAWYSDNGFPQLVPGQFRTGGKVDPLKLIPAIAAMANGGTPGLDGVTGNELFAMAAQWTNQYAPNKFNVHWVPGNDWLAIYNQLRQCQDVIVLLGFYGRDNYNHIVRNGGHFLTLAGAGNFANAAALAFSDPYFDSAAARLSAGRWNGPNGDPRVPGSNPANHNNTANYSHDLFNIMKDPLGNIGLPGYGLSTTLNPFFSQNAAPTSVIPPSQPGVFIDCVFAVSPLWPPIFSSPTVSNGRVFYGRDDGMLFGCNTDGTSVPGFPVNISAVIGQPAAIRSRPAVYYTLASPDPSIYLTTDTGFVVCLNMDGTPKWKVQPYPTVTTNTSTPAVTLDGFVYVGIECPCGARVLKLSALTGQTLVESPQLGSGRISSPALGNDRVFVGLTNGVVGNIVVLDMNLVPRNAAIAPGENVLAPPYTKGVDMYVGTKAGNVYAVNAFTSAPDARFGTNGEVVIGEPMSSSPFGDTNAWVPGGTVYLGTDMGRVLGLDAISGAITFSFFDGDPTSVVQGIVLDRTTGTLAFGAGDNFYEVPLGGGGAGAIVLPSGSANGGFFTTTPTFDAANGVFYIGHFDGACYQYPLMF